MPFDPCPYLIKTIVIAAGKEIRKAKGLPEEKNITILYEETSAILGLSPIDTKATSSRDGDERHQISFVDKNTGIDHTMPKRTCPACHSESYTLYGLCRSCADAEGGKYKSMWKCSCGYKDKSPRPILEWLNEFKIDFKTQTKESLGIKTVTDEGVK